jgi:hypothetical protein
MRGGFPSSSNRQESSSEPVGITNHPLPSALNGTYSWIHHSSIVTEGTRQHVVWVDDNRKVRIARRYYTREWEPSVDLSVQTGTAFSAQATLDSHNYIAVAEDDQGYIHVSGDMHAVALKYMRSTTPGSLTDWTTGMVGTEETSATYPHFFKAKNGVLYFWYRTGSSGDGDWVLNRWNSSTLTWTRVALVLQGTVENVSAYPQEITVDHTTGRWHMLWTIRKDFVGPEENENIYAAYSDDNGVTWRKYSDNSAYSLPITWASGEIVVPLTGCAVGTILNGGNTTIAPDGNPHSVWLVEDESSVYRYRHVWFDGATWHYDTLMPTTNSSGRMPALFYWPDGRKWMFFQNGAGGRANTLRYYDLDADTETLILDVNMRHYLPVVKYARGRGVVYVLAPYERQDGSIAGDPADLGAQLNVPFLALR